jgi:hypothetical protein
MSDTTPPFGVGISCSSPKAIAPMVAAAANGHHQRSGRVASGTRDAGATDAALDGPARTSRRAAARIATSSSADGSSREAARHAESGRVATIVGFGDVIAGPRAHTQPRGA